jgi:uncharacterized protein with ATP-grasp and redox domains
MQIAHDCLSCFVRQALTAVRNVTDDVDVHESVLRTVLGELSRMDLRCSPVVVARRIHELVRQRSGSSDPYAAEKQRFNRLALSLLPELEARVANSADPWATALRLAIAGNVIDFGPRSHVSVEDVTDAVAHALEAPLAADVAGFRAEAEGAERILYLTDNAGEIVFDRLLLALLPADRVTVAVRGAPVINDATLEDAREAGLTERWDVISNGSDAPGTLLDTCSTEFRARFEAADLVIAKGQGNYESLSGCGRDVVFVLKVKCEVIGRALGCPVGTLVVRRGNGGGTCCV